MIPIALKNKINHFISLFNNLKIYYLVPFALFFKKNENNVVKSKILKVKIKYKHILPNIEQKLIDIQKLFKKNY